MDTNESRGQRGFFLNQKIVENEKARRALLIENIDYLAEVLDAQLYKEILGDEDSEWAGFLAQLDVWYTRAEVNRYIKLRRKLQLELGFDLKELLDIPLLRLEAIADHTKTKAEAEKLIEIASVATPRDWREEINTFLGKPTEDDGHEHDFKKFEVCKVCGLKHALDDESGHEKV
jgi:hypothetical protein